MKYVSTYYYANIIQGIINNSSNHLRELDEIFSDHGVLGYVTPFRKKSNLLEFIEFVLNSLFKEESLYLKEYDCRDISSHHFEGIKFVTPLERVFKLYEVEYLTFMDWRKNFNKASNNDEDFTEYYEYLHLTYEYSKVLSLLSDEIFYILFQNRDFLKKFNELLASYLMSCDGDTDAINIFIEDGLEEYVRSDFKLKRISIPKWVERAVLFRDRGRCVNCGKDLSGYLSLDENIKNYDHIVPLNLYGFNDISNFQLLCRNCNSKKSGSSSLSGTKYQRWYEI